MKKLIIGFLSALACASFALAQSADTTETWTNALGQVFTVVDGLEGYATVPSAATYALDATAYKLLAQNVSGGQVEAFVTYLFDTGAAALTNVTFAAPYPTGKIFTFYNAGTQNMIFPVSATFDVGASNVTLGTTDVLTMLAVNTGLCVKVSTSDN